MNTVRKRMVVHPRDEILDTMERIYRYRMTTTSGGNLSILDDDGFLWITPSRVDKGSLRREDSVCVPNGVQFTDPDGLAQRVPPEQPVALLENDGVLVCGRGLLDAFDRLEVLESTAEAVIGARHIGSISAMSGRVVAEMKKAFKLKTARRGRRVKS